MAMEFTTSFVCDACKEAADRKEYGRKNHMKAGCRGDQACDCAHRVPRGQQ